MIFSGSVRTRTHVFTNPICFPAAKGRQDLGSQPGCSGITKVQPLETSSIPDLTGGWTTEDPGSWPTTPEWQGKVGCRETSGPGGRGPKLVLWPQAALPLPTWPAPHLWQQGPLQSHLLAQNRITGLIYCTGPELLFFLFTSLWLV